MKRLLWIVFLTTSVLHAQNVAFKKLIDSSPLDTKLATLTDSEQKESGVMLLSLIHI